MFAASFKQLIKVIKVLKNRMIEFKYYLKNRGLLLFGRYY